jgi:hypothetical protein
MRETWTPTSLATRIVKVLVYWPLEEEHAQETGAMAWIIFLSWMFLGIAASFENLVFGFGLSIAGVYGGAFVRYLIVNWERTGDAAS